MKKWFKLLLATCNRIYMVGTFRKKQKLILYYHGVLDHEVVNFEMQLDYLVRECRIVPLREILNTELNEKKTVIALTFDDAFANLLDNAIPQLRKRNIPAAIFAPAGNLGDYPKWTLPSGCADADQLIMTAEQLTELDRLGYEIYSHTLTHKRLTQCSYEEVTSELADSKRKLESVLGHSINAVSYPHGAVNETIIEIGKASGYEYGFTIDPQCLDSRRTVDHRIPRFCVLPSDGIYKFKLIAHGAFQIEHYLRALKKFVTRQK